MLVFIEQQSLVRLCSLCQSCLVAGQDTNLGNSAPAGLLGSRFRNLLPALQLLFQALLIRFRNTADRRKGNDLKRAQFRCLLNHMLQFIRLCKGHIYTDLHSCFCGRCKPLHYLNIREFGSNPQDRAYRFPALTVADTDLLPFFQTKHPGMLGIFPSQG